MIRHALVICSDNKISNLRSLFLNSEIVNFDDTIVVITTERLDNEVQNSLQQSITASEITFLVCDKGLVHKRLMGFQKIKNDHHIIHFIDDDFSLGSGYFQSLKDHLSNNLNSVGVGAFFRQEMAPPNKSQSRKLFLLDSNKPGLILKSGWTTNAQAISPSEKYPTDTIKVQWLSGCSMSYKTAILDKLSWPIELNGYSMDEDLILSYCASKFGELFVVPIPGSEHKREMRSRSNPEFKAMALKARKHFVSSYFMKPFSIFYYYWSLIGVILALMISWRREKGLFSKFLSELWK